MTAAAEEEEFELSLLILCKANPEAPEDGDEVGPPTVGNGKGTGKGVNCGLGGGIKALDEDDDVTAGLRGDGMMNLSATVFLSLVFVLVVVATGLPILPVPSSKPGGLFGPVPMSPNVCECPCAPRPPPVEPTIALGGDLALPTPALPSSLSSRTACLLSVGT